MSAPTPYKNGIVALCNKETATELFYRQMIGLPLEHLPLVEHLKDATSAVFVYNFSTRCMHGPFVACGRPGINLEPQAWEGRFKAQCHFQLAPGYAKDGALPASVWSHLFPKKTHARNRVRLLSSNDVAQLLSLFATTTAFSPFIPNKEEEEDEECTNSTTTTTTTTVNDEAISLCVHFGDDDVENLNAVSLDDLRRQLGWGEEKVAVEFSLTQPATPDELPPLLTPTHFRKLAPGTLLFPFQIKQV